MGGGYVAEIEISSCSSSALWTPANSRIFGRRTTAHAWSDDAFNTVEKILRGRGQVLEEQASAVP
jgi:hypothetical protein